MIFSGDRDAVLDELTTRISDSTDDILTDVLGEAQGWSLAHLRMRYVDREWFFHAFVVDCMIRNEERRQEDRGDEQRELALVHYNGERLMPADPTQLHEYQGRDL